MLEESKVEDDRGGDEDPQDREVLALLPHVTLAGLPDNVGDIEHGLVRGKCDRLLVLHESKECAKH